MNSVKILGGIFFIFLTVPFLNAGEKDILKEWIKEDIEQETVKHLEKLVAEREKTKLKESQITIKQLYEEAGKLEKSERYDEAREKYEKILALNPDEAKAREGINRLDKLKGIFNKREIKKNLRQGKREKREKFQRLSYEGIELYTKKQYREAREKWEEALKYEPRNEELKIWIARARLGEIEKAREEALLEKKLEEKRAFSAIDEAYLPKREKAKVERAEEEIETKEEAAKRKLEEMLEKIEISELHLKDVDLRKIVNEISSRTKVTILVDWTAISEATGSGITTMHLDLNMYNPMPLKSFLDYLMKLTRLKYRVETHAVLISTPEALEKEEMVVKVYKLKYGMTKLRPVTLKPLGSEEKRR